MSGLEIALVLVPVLGFIVGFPLAMLALTSLNRAPKVFAHDPEVIGSPGAFPELRTRPPLRAARLVWEHRRRSRTYWLAHVDAFHLPGVRNVRVDRAFGLLRVTALRHPWTDEELSRALSVSGPDAEAMRTLLGQRSFRDALRRHPAVEWSRIEVSPVGHVTLHLRQDDGSPAMMKRTLMEVVRMVEVLEAAAKTSPA